MIKLFMVNAQYTVSWGKKKTNTFFLRVCSLYQWVAIVDFWYHLKIFLHVTITYIPRCQIADSLCWKSKRICRLTGNEVPLWLCFSLKPAFRSQAANWSCYSHLHNRAIPNQMKHLTSGVVTMWGPTQIRQTKPVCWWGFQNNPQSHVPPIL